MGMKGDVAEEDICAASKGCFSFAMIDEGDQYCLVVVHNQDWMQCLFGAIFIWFRVFMCVVPLRGWFEKSWLMMT